MKTLYPDNFPHFIELNGMGLLAAVIVAVIVAVIYAEKGQWKRTNLAKLGQFRKSWTSAKQFGA